MAWTTYYASIFRSAWSILRLASFMSLLLVARLLYRDVEDLLIGVPVVEVVDGVWVEPLVALVLS